MPKLYHVTLEKSEQERLEKIIQTLSTKSPQVRRSYVLLAADENGSKSWKDEQIQKVYGVSIATIERLRCRFVEDGLDIALKGKKREVFLEKIFDGRVESHLIALKCSDPPLGSSKWSLRLLAGKMIELDYVESISHESVRTILKKTE